jgi:hypothetical protein
MDLHSMIWATWAPSPSTLPANPQLQEQPGHEPKKHWPASASPRWRAHGYLRRIPGHGRRCFGSWWTYLVEVRGRFDEMGNFIGSDLTPRQAEGDLDGLFLQIWMKTLPSGLLQRGLHVDAWMIGSVETLSVSCETKTREGGCGTA